MLNCIIFNERPAELLYAALPDGKADVWIRRNIREFAAEEDADGETVTVTSWAAEEAYMRTKLTREEIEADLDGAFAIAGAWRQGDDEEACPTDDERISLLEAENRELFRQLTDTRLALCELYESIFS